MKNLILRIIPIVLLTFLMSSASGQNVGINCPIPIGKFHIKGSGDVSQFIIDANSIQNNSNPLIKLRNANGIDLMSIHTDDTSNVFMGLRSGRVNNVTGGGINNTFIGKNSGYSNTTGNNNTAYGKRSLFQNNTGGSNCAFGSNALYSNTNGICNIAIGRDALFSTTTGDYNTAIGNEALYTTSTTSYNTAVGYLALKYSTASFNAALGSQALFDNTVGDKNVAIGHYAMGLNKGGSQATAVGYHAMFNCNQNPNSFIKYDVAVGFEALYGGSPSNTGNYNTALGYKTIHSNTTGAHNTATGYSALIENSTGSSNTSNGSEALPINTTGNNNSAFGKSSLFQNITGNGNTALGGYAYFTSTALNNTTCIGYLSGGNVNASNRVEIGNTSITWIGGNQTWSTYSDGRIKENVEANVPGLEFINQLRPVTYNLNIHTQNEMVYAGKQEVSDWPEKYDVEKMRITGFIAQEVAQAAVASGYNFSGVDIPENPDELYSIRYSDFVMPLVKAVQELSESNTAVNATIEALKDEIEFQKEENAKLAARLTILEGLVLRAEK